MAAGRPPPLPGPPRCAGRPERDVGVLAGPRSPPGRATSITGETATAEPSGAAGAQPAGGRACTRPERASGAAEGAPACSDAHVGPRSSAQGPRIWSACARSGQKLLDRGLALELMYRHEWEVCDAVILTNPWGCARWRPMPSGHRTGFCARPCSATSQFSSRAPVGSSARSPG